MRSFLLARLTRSCSMFLLAGAFACLPARAQISPDQPVPLPPGPPSAAAGHAAGFANPADPEQMRILHSMLKQRNVLRQKEIVDDTNRLLDLAKQLKDDVDRSNKDQLSLSVINTASEMEKLAKAVKEKMRDGE